MTRTILSEWEINGYDDSDWEAAVWNDETNRVERVLVGTTRCANKFMYDGISFDLNEEIIEKAVAWLRDAIFHDLKVRETNAVERPDDLKNGDRVVLNRSKRGHKSIQVACEKCEGTGHWINPNNEDDVRDCFACNGTGFTFEKAPKVDGKVQWETFEEGTVGTVVWVGTFRKIWHNGGYNRRGRLTLSARVRTDDGRLFSADLIDLSMYDDVMPDAEIAEYADRLSRNMQWGKALNPRHAWDSRHYAAEYLSKIGS